MKGEELPDGERFSLLLTWTWEGLAACRDPEHVVNGLLREAKQRIMQHYRDHQPAPAFMLPALEPPE